MLLDNGRVGKAREADAAKLRESWPKQLAPALHFPAALIALREVSGSGNGTAVVVELWRTSSSGETVASRLRPEEAALVMEERIRYGELRLVDWAGTRVEPDRTSTRISVLLRVGSAESNLLPIIVGGAVGGLFLVVLLFVIGLVVVKQKQREDKVGVSPSTSPDLASPPHSATGTSSTLTVIRRLSVDRSFNQ